MAVRECFLCFAAAQAKKHIWFIHSSNEPRIVWHRKGTTHTVPDPSWHKIRQSCTSQCRYTSSCPRSHCTISREHLATHMALVDVLELAVCTAHLWSHCRGVHVADYSVQFSVDACVCRQYQQSCSLVINPSSFTLCHLNSLLLLRNQVIVNLWLILSIITHVHVSPNNS